VSFSTKTIALDNDVAEVTRAAEFVEKFCTANGVPPGVAFKLNVVAEELLVNTISYGFPDGLRHRIVMEIAKLGGEVILTIEDDGIAFDPLAEAPPPDLDAALEDRKVGGLGVHFVKTMMDEVRYVRQGNRNYITLKKKIAE
jgi:anti-sigma regulatory factor (Ser/Thr protein kinase)